MKKIRTVITLGIVMLMSISLTACAGVSNFDYDFDMTEFITLGEYKGLEYVAPPLDVTDEEIEAEIQSRREMAMLSEEITEGVVEEGDTVTVDFEGKIDGETFEGGSSDNFVMQVLSGQMIDGFTEGMVGVTVGETVVLDLKFPDEYQNTEVAGKDVQFSITIHNKLIDVLPEYDEEFIKADTEDLYDNKEEYEEYLSGLLLAQKEVDEATNKDNTLWGLVATGTEIKSYPQDAVDFKTEQLIKQFNTEAAMYGITYEEYILQATQTDVETFESTTLVEIAQESVAQDMIVHEISNLESLEITETEYVESLDALLADSGYTRETFESSMQMSIEEYAVMMNIRTSMLWEKVMEVINEHSVSE